MSDEIRNVSVADGREMIAHGAVVLDVREDDEWDAGHAPDATHIRLSELPDRLHDIPVNVVVLCVCRSGGRSGRATAFLLENGRDAVNLEGGMQAWEAQEAPLIGDREGGTII